MGIVRCVFESKGEMVTKGREGVIVSGTDGACGEVGMNSDEMDGVNKGPDEESE